MNYFAHGYRFIDRPYFLAGTAVPDWLSVVDRQVRLRSRLVEPFLDDLEGEVALVAGGVLQHLRDDALFHGTRAFAELSLELGVLIRGALDGETGFRPGFLGHLLVEVLLDASLIADNPARLDGYYAALLAVSPARVEECVNRMATRPTRRLGTMISAFCAARILSDYRQDGTLLVRLNQVMRRVGLAELPATFIKLLPEARRRVEMRRSELLAGVFSAS